jgi:hypothetical protein
MIRPNGRRDDYVIAIERFLDRHRIRDYRFVTRSKLGGAISRPSARP